MTLTADIEGVEGTIWLHGEDGLLLEGDPILLGARRSEHDEVSVFGRFEGYEDVVSLRMDRDRAAAFSVMVAEAVVA